MSRLSLLGLTVLCLLCPAALWANNKSYNEATIDLLDGTVMVQHADGTKSNALETGSTVQKGDTLLVYDKSWVILKTHKGDRIGLDSNTSVNFDEYFIEGPDRQIRLVLQKGTMLLKTNGCGSRQSFFEVNSGNVVTSINDVRAQLKFDAAKQHLKVQYLSGKLTVIDKDNEQKIKEQHTEHNWESGKMVPEDAFIPIDEVDVINFNRFFNGDPPLPPPDNNMILNVLEKKR
jgi:hypothetical protein